MGRPRARISATLRQRASWTLLLGLSFFCLVFLELRPVAQPAGGVILKNFRAPSVDGKRRAVVSGKEAEQVGNGFIRIVGARVESFQTNGELELLIEAPLAFFNQQTKMAFSPGALKVSSYGGKLNITGVGFQWQQSSNLLSISNDVRAVIAPELLSTNFAKRFASDAETNGSLVITSEALLARPERADFLRNATAELTDGSIKAEERLSVLFGAKRFEVQRIEGAKNVVIAREDLRMSGSRADYAMDAAGEIITVSGDGEWNKGGRKGSADLIEYKPALGRILARGKGHLEAPLFRGSDTNLAKTRPLVVVDADVFHLQMETPDIPTQKLEAHTNVVIRIPSEGAVARTQSALYDEADATLRLLGNPVWTTPEWELTGDQILVNERDQTVHASANARLKVAASAFGIDEFFRRPAGGLPAAPQEPWFVHTTSESLFYNPSKMQLQNKVHVRVFEGTNERGWSKSDALVIHLRSSPDQPKTTNTLPSLKAGSVERVVALGNVTAEQFPWKRATGDIVSKKLRAQEVAFAFQPGRNAALDSITVWEKARLEQTSIHPQRTQPSNVSLEAEKIVAKFFPHTNRIDTIHATTNVVIQHGRGFGRGHHVVYTGSNDVVELSGNEAAKPFAKMDGNNVQADVLIWQRARGTVGTRGSVIAEWTQVTNAPALPKR